MHHHDGIIYQKSKLSHVTHFLLIMRQDHWSQKEALLTNCCHGTIYHIYASSVSLTHWYQYHQILPTRIWWQWLACISFSCLLAIWSMTNLVFMWRHWSVTYLLMNICKYLSLYMKVTYLPVHLLPFKFPMLMCSLTKMHTQKCGNFEKTRIMTSSHVQSLYFRTCLNNVNVSKWHFECDPHQSADSTQRSRLFICVETNSSCMLWSSIALAVCWINSAQLFSGKSMSIKQHYSHFQGVEIFIMFSPSNLTYALGGYLASKTLGR